MLTLPRGCRCSELSVFPKNWKNGASIKTNWRIQYYFYSPDHPKGKLKIVKGGINAIKDYNERKRKTQLLLERHKALLLQGYNPVKKRIIYPENNDQEITEYSHIHTALEWAYQEIKTGQQNKEAIKSCWQRVKNVLHELNISAMMLNEIKTRHIRKVLIRVAEKYHLSAYSFNHYRAYLMQLFKILLEIDAVDYNPVQNISKQKPLKKLKTLLTPAERKKINDHFKSTDIYFFRFIHCFFHSGARPIELLEIKKEDVDLINRTYKITVKKGRLYEEQLRPIKNIAFEFWNAQYNECKSGNYLFGSCLKPGIKQGKRDYITKKWQREVKKKLKIHADLYSLKHLNLDQTAALLNAEDASKMAGHTSTIITMNHYLINEKMRQEERLRKLDNSF